MGSISTQDSSSVSITGGAISGASVTTASATITGGTITGITDLAIADGGTGASTAAGARSALSAATTSQTDFLSIPWLTVDNGTYTVVVNSPIGYTINSVTTKCTSGTATLTVKINNTALGGSANAISSSEVTESHASANTLVAGDDLVFVFSSASACISACITLNITRTLS